MYITAAQAILATNFAAVGVLRLHAGAATSSDMCHRAYIKHQRHRPQEQQAGRLHLSSAAMYLHLSTKVSKVPA